MDQGVLDRRHASRRKASRVSPLSLSLPFVPGVVSRAEQVRDPSVFPSLILSERLRRRPLSYTTVPPSSRFEQLHHLSLLDESHFVIVTRSKTLVGCIHQTSSEFQNHSNQNFETENFKVGSSSNFNKLKKQRLQTEMNRNFRNENSSTPRANLEWRELKRETSGPCKQVAPLSHREWIESVCDGELYVCDTLGSCRKVWADSGMLGDVGEVQVDVCKDGSGTMVMMMAKGERWTKVLDLRTRRPVFMWESPHEIRSGSWGAGRAALLLAPAYAPPFALDIRRIGQGCAGIWSTFSLASSSSSFSSSSSSGKWDKFTQLFDPPPRPHSKEQQVDHIQPVGLSRILTSSLEPCGQQLHKLWTLHDGTPLGDLLSFPTTPSNSLEETLTLQHERWPKPIIVDAFHDETRKERENDEGRRELEKEEREPREETAGGLMRLYTLDCSSGKRVLEYVWDVNRSWKGDKYPCGELHRCGESKQEDGSERYGTIGERKARIEAVALDLRGETVVSTNSFGQVAWTKAN